MTTDAQKRAMFKADAKRRDTSKVVRMPKILFDSILRLAEHENLTFVEFLNKIILKELENAE